MGVTLKELSTYTVSGDWKTKVMAMGEEITNKLAKIEDFSLFLDFH